MPGRRWAVAMVVGLALMVGGARAQERVSAVGEDGGSQVRIVRLSQARGEVGMDRGMGRGPERAVVNMPVVGGAVLRTGDGIAEVEFEDNSTLRLGPLTEVRFLQLSRSAAGSTQTTISVARGLVYAGLEKTKGGVFTLERGPARMALAPGAHLRLDATRAEAELAVFEGGVAVTLGGATTNLSKQQTMQLNPGAGTMSVVAHGVGVGDWDGWDREAVAYHHQQAGLAGSGGVGLYGVNDLNYYGGFADLAGCGTVWRPYLASAGWDPFANGVWTYYQGAGYSWVSPYPWGWLPFHSGSWVDCGAGGWGWRPGGAWMGLGNRGVMRIAKCPHPPVAPGLPPERGKPTMVAVNARPLAISGVKGEGFAFRRDSAGLGVPREEFGSLRRVSARVEVRGVAMRGVPEGSMVGAEAAGRGVGAAGRGVERSGAAPAHGFAAGAGAARGGSFSAAAHAGGGGSFGGGGSGGAAHGGGGAPAASAGVGASAGGGHR